MGHSTSSGRTAQPQRSSLTADERAALRQGDQQARAILTAYNDRLKDDKRTLERIYSETRDMTPEDTVSRFVSEVGNDRAERTVATLVNNYDWDGRIGARNIEWARSVEGALTSDETRRGGYGSNEIHASHIDQIASAMRRRRNT